MRYELVCGLETHVELMTDEKIFCNCLSRFGGEPNTRVCPVCMGLPGTLPVLNTQAAELAVKAALALGCEVNEVSYFDRKSYFYPDLSKAFQISQYDRPFCSGGTVTLPSGAKIRLERIHLEEDAGKLIHESDRTLIDYNRVGVPLIEIVTKPDFTKAEDAAEYLEQLRLIMRHCGVSDCRMQEGSLRCDVNVSVRPVGSEALGVKTEIKNINSMSFVKKAIEYEFTRQCDIIEKGGTVEPETRRWDSVSGVTVTMREKEKIKDYRFMREPDLAPLILKRDYVESIRKTLPVLPHKRAEGYIQMGISPADAQLLARHKSIADFFDGACGKAPKTTAKLMLSKIFARLKTEEEMEKCDLLITPSQLGELAFLLESGKINAAVARDMLDKMLDTGRDAAEFMPSDDLDDDTLSAICRQAAQDNKAACADYLAGKEKAIMSVIGAVMRQTKGRADAAKVREILITIINNYDI